MAPPGKHVMSCFVQYAPYHLSDGAVWDDAERTRSATRSSTRSRSASRTSANLILHAQVLTPLDIERITGLTEGNIFQGELSLEQLFFNRPVPGWARYRTPIKDLWMCGSATHPGGGIMGAPGRIAALELLKAQDRREGGVTPRRFDAVVIGAGHNGLVAAAYLGKAGPEGAGARAPGARRRDPRHDRDRPRRPSAGHRAHGRAAPAVGDRGSRPGSARARHRRARRPRVRAAARGPAADAVGRRRAHGVRARANGRRGTRRRTPRSTGGSGRSRPSCRTCTPSRRRT